MQSIDKIYYSIRSEPEFAAIYKYIISLLGTHYDFEPVENNQTPHLIIGSGSNNSITLSQKFKDLYLKNELRHSSWFIDEPLLYNKSTPDYLGTAFYMINSLQEYQSDQYDKYGRFPYKASYQSKFHCIDKDLVSLYLDKAVKGTPIEQLISKKRQSTVFLSHDIDRITSWKKQEAKYVLTSKSIKSATGLLKNWFSSPWFNIEDIMNLHDKYSMKSTFFWLVEKGDGIAKIQNADYNFSSILKSGILKKVEQKGFENGIHKSASEKSFHEELKKLPVSIKANRNHYLKMRLPGFYNQIERAGIQFDSTLSFSEIAGFRNSYSRAFIPFDVKNNKPYSFVEYPLQLMDVTLCNSMFNSPKEAEEHIVNFLQKHKSNANIAILWHNNYLTKGRYKDWLALYSKILKTLNELNYICITPSKFLERFPNFER